MNKIGLFVAFLTTLMVLTPLSSATPQTEIQVRNINPKPAAPGDTVRLDLLVKNAGNSEGTYKSMEIETTEAITYQGTTSNFDGNFSLCGGCQTVGTVYLKVDEDTTSGSYPLDVKVVVTDEISVVEKTVIEVESTPNIIATGEAEVKQGGSSEFDLELENIGRDEASQVTVSLNHSRINFNPSTVRYSDLGVDGSELKTVEVTASEDIRSGPTKARATIEYVDDNQRMTQKRSIPVQILKDVELAVSRVETEGAVIGSKSRLMVEMENIGNSEAKAINSQVTCDGAEETEDTDFVGSLDSEESVPTVYYVTPEQKSVDCTLDVSYKGEEEQSLQETFKIKAQKKTNVIFLAAVGFLVLVGVIYLYYQRKE